MSAVLAAQEVKVELKQAAMQAAEYAGIKPNDMVRFIVDYGNSIDPIEPCAAVMTFCERFAELIKAANAEVRGD